MEVNRDVNGTKDGRTVSYKTLQGLGDAQRVVRAFVSKQEDQSLDPHGSLPSIPVSPWKVAMGSLEQAGLLDRLARWMNSGLS